MEENKIRFGEYQLYNPKIRGMTFAMAKVILKIFGSFDTSSSHLHFMRIVEKVAKTRLNTVLDAGCGDGKFSFWLAQKYPNAKIDACDLSEEIINRCKEIQGGLKTRNVNFFVQDLRNLKSEGAYDFIFSNHVLEHVIDNQLVISNLVSSLNREGYLYIQIPTAIQKRLSFGKRFLRSHEAWAKKEHIGQTLTLSLLSSELKRLDCKILIARHTEGFWGELRFELKELALGYLQSRILLGLFFPLLHILGYIDSLVNCSDGNGILILAKKKH